MSKTLSLKLKDAIFEETEEIIETLHKPRNAYINEALSFYNKLVRRKRLKERLKKESRMVSASSMEALRELELLEKEAESACLKGLCHNIVNFKNVITS